MEGSDDGSARVWDVASGQCIRILSHRGPLTNAFYAPRYKHLETDKFHPNVIINTFEKKRGDGPAVESEMTAQLHVRHPPLMTADKESSTKKQLEHAVQLTQQVTENELEHLKRINHELYKFTVDKILSKVSTNNGVKKRK